jgi:hypothetical protein
VAGKSPFTGSDYIGDHFDLPSFSKKVLPQFDLKAQLKSSKVMQNKSDFNTQCLEALALQSLAVGQTYNIYQWTDHLVDIVIGLKEVAQALGLSSLSDAQIASQYGPDMVNVKLFIELFGEVGDPVLIEIVSNLYEVLLGGYSQGAWSVYNNFLRKLAVDSFEGHFFTKGGNRIFYNEGYLWYYDEAHLRELISQGKVDPSLLSGNSKVDTRFEELAKALCNLGVDGGRPSLHKLMTLMVLFTTVSRGQEVSLVVGSQQAPSQQRINKVLPFIEQILQLSIVAFEATRGRIPLDVHRQKSEEEEAALAFEEFSGKQTPIKKAIAVTKSLLDKPLFVSLADHSLVVKQLLTFKQEFGWMMWPTGHVTIDPRHLDYIRNLKGLDTVTVETTSKVVETQPVEEKKKKRTPLVPLPAATPVTPAATPVVPVAPVATLVATPVATPEATPVAKPATPVVTSSAAPVQDKKSQKLTELEGVLKQQQDLAQQLLQSMAAIQAEIEKLKAKEDDKDDEDKDEDNGTGSNGSKPKPGPKPQSPSGQQANNEDWGETVNTVALSKIDESFIDSSGFDSFVDDVYIDKVEFESNGNGCEPNPYSQTSSGQQADNDDWGETVNTVPLDFDIDILDLTSYEGDEPDPLSEVEVKMVPEVTADVVTNSSPAQSLEYLSATSNASASVIPCLEAIVKSVTSSDNFKATMESVLKELNPLNLEQRYFVAQFLYKGFNSSFDPSGVNPGNFILNGEAGTGKSFTVAALVRIAVLLNYKVIVTGTTGASVVALPKFDKVTKGTFNQIFGLGSGYGNSEHKKLSQKEALAQKAVKACNRHFHTKQHSGVIVVVDEYSMLGGCLAQAALEGLTTFCSRMPRRPSRNVQWLLVGDPQQLAPVNDYSVMQPSHFVTPKQNEDDKGFITVAPFIEQLKVNTFKLRVPNRQQSNSAFAKELSFLAKGFGSPDAMFSGFNPLCKEIVARALLCSSSVLPKDGLRVVHSREGCQRINNSKLKELLLTTNAKVYTFTSSVSVFSEFSSSFSQDDLLSFSRAELSLQVCIGAFVRVVTNVYRGNQLYVANGQRGTVESISPEEISVRLFDTNEVKTLQRVDFPVPTIEGLPVGTVKQMPLTLSWASTVHSCQGLTLDNIIIDLTHGGNTPSLGHLENGLYVSASRVKSIEGLFFYLDHDQRDIANETEEQKMFYVSRVIPLLKAVYRHNALATEWLNARYGDEDRLYSVSIADGRVIDSAPSLF